jgi:hypothetical protein
MYTVLTKGEMPILISKNNLEYNDYILSGYELVFSGKLRECQKVIDDIVESIYE